MVDKGTDLFDKKPKLFDKTKQLYDKLLGLIDKFFGRLASDLIIFLLLRGGGFLLVREDVFGGVGGGWGEVS